MIRTVRGHSIAGYYYQQLTDDHTRLGTISSDKGMVFGVGPAFFYNMGKWVFDLHAAYETEAKNRPHGVQAVFSVVYSLGKLN